MAIFRTSGGVAEHKAICSFPFYEIQIGCNGEIFPCCSVASARDKNGGWVNACQGNIVEESLADYWSGKRLREFRGMMISHNRNKHPICTSCPLVQYEMQPEDILDGYEETLANIYL